MNSKGLKHFTKEHVHLIKCSTFLTSKEMQIKATMRYHFTLNNKQETTILGETRAA